MLLRVINSIIAICFTMSCFAQLVNIESKRMHTDSIRFVLKSDLSFSHNNNNGDYIFQVGGALTAQLKSKDLNKIYFLIGNYNLIRSEGQDFQNNWFAHFRFNYQLTEFWRLESFVQSQSNELLDVNLRNLIGVGVRMKLISKDHFRMYLGNAYMYEEEKSNALNKSFYNHRNSTYLSTSYTSKKNTISLLNTIYYQPLYRDLGNYRILEQFKAEVPISEKINIFCLYNYYFNSHTPQDREEYSSNLSVGIGFNI